MTCSRLFPHFVQILDETLITWLILDITEIHRYLKKDDVSTKYKIKLLVNISATY